VLCPDVHQFSFERVEASNETNVTTITTEASRCVGADTRLHCRAVRRTVVSGLGAISEPLASTGGGLLGCAVGRDGIGEVLLAL
jgi:hypothetical protein